MKQWLKAVKRVNVMPRPGGIDLRYSEWTEMLSPPLFDEFIKTLTWEDFALYPDTNILRSRIAEHHSIKPENIYLGAGSSECISDVFMCLRQHCSVTLTSPCFPMYHVYAAQSNLTLNEVPTSKHFTYDAAGINGGDMIVISRPTTPIGYFFTRTDIISILKNNPTSWVLVDEAYIDYVENRDDIIDLIGVYDNLIISRTFSKCFGAAGSRVGYLISHTNNIELVSTLRPMYEITGPSQKYAMFLLNHLDEIHTYCKTTIQERKDICGLFTSANFNVVSSNGNWIHVEQTGELLSKLDNAGVRIKQDIILPHHECKWIRLTVGPRISSLIEKLLH